MSWIVGTQNKPEYNPQKFYDELDNLKGFLPEDQAKRYLFRLFKEDVSLAAYMLFGVELGPHQHIFLKAMMNNDYVLEILSRGSGKTICINNQHYLLDKNLGVITSEDIAGKYKGETKEKIYEVPELELWNGESFQKTNKILYQPQKFCIRVTSSRGYFVEGSKNHKVKVLDSKKCKITWKRYHELNKEIDYICIPKNETPEWGISPCSDNDAYLAGILTGDGSTNKQSWTITNADEEILSFSENYGSKRKQKKGSKAFCIRISNKNRDNLIKKLEMPKHCLSYHKRIPKKIFQSKRSLKVFLSGLFDTDGSWEKDRRQVTYSSVSKGLAYDVHKALLLFGIVSRISKKKTPSTFGVSYNISMSGENGLKFFELVGFKIKRKQLGKKNLKSSKRNTNVDVIYGAKDYILENVYDRVPTKNAKGFRKKIKPDQHNYSRDKFNGIIEKLEELEVSADNNLTEIYKSNYFFDPITSIEESVKDCIDFCDIPNGSSYWCNGFINHNSFIAGIFAAIYALMNPGVKIGILAPSFRQAKLLFKKIEEISMESGAEAFKDCIIGNPSHNSDMWEMKIGKSSIIALPLGCLHESSFIMQDDGFRHIGSIFQEENKRYKGQWSDYNKNIWSQNQYKLSDKKFYNGKSETKKIVTKKGFEIEGTYNHKIKILNSNLDIIWKRFDEIQESDIILIDRTNIWFPNTNDVTPEEAYLLGAFIADGCWTRKYSLRFINTDKSIIQNVFDCSPPEYNWKKSPNEEKYDVNSKILRQEWLDKWDLQKCYSWEKYLPDRMLSAPKESMSACLRGLYDCDGGISVPKSKSNKGGATVHYTTTSEQLSIQIQQILLKYGIVAFRKYRDRQNEIHTNSEGREVRSKRRIYEILINGQNLLKFYEQIGFGSKPKQQKLEEFVLNAKRFGTCTDGIPYVKDIAVDIASNNRIPKGMWKHDHCGPFNLKRKKILTKESCIKFCDQYSFVNDERLQKILDLTDENLYFDSVKEIKNGECETFDVQVPSNKTYTANGFISHNTGEKLRGFRFQCLVIDELLLMPEKTLSEVILPFLGVVPNPTQRENLKQAENILIEHGEMTEEERHRWPNNKFIGLSSASYQFEYLYELYQVYENLILRKDSEVSDIQKKMMEKMGGNQASRALIHLSYEAIPEYFYDQNLLIQALESMTPAQFDREFKSKFIDESGGFFNMKKMHDCTIEEGGRPCLKVKGDSDKQYLVAIDPSWAENEGSDDFGMQVIELDFETRTGTLVHSYARAGAPLRDHIQYFHYILTNFNICAVWIDYGGGVQFIGSCNESSLFKESKIKLTAVDEDFENLSDYPKCIRNARNLYNKEAGNILFYRKFTAPWIRSANELLQAKINSKKIWFGGRCIDDTWDEQAGKDIPIKPLIFDQNNEPDYSGVEIGVGGKLDPKAKTMSLIEKQYDLVNLTKAECALIEPKSNPQGHMTFDLPTSLKKQTGPNKTRRDSYTALLIGVWGMDKHFDIFSKKIDTKTETFMPFFVR